MFKLFRVIILIILCIFFLIIIRRLRCVEKFDNSPERIEKIAGWCRTSSDKKYNEFKKEITGGNIAEYIVCKENLRDKKIDNSDFLYKLS